MIVHPRDFQLGLYCRLHFQQVAPDKLEPERVEHELTGELPQNILVKISDFIAAECHDDLLEFLTNDAAECAAG